MKKILVVMLSLISLTCFSQWKRVDVSGTKNPLGHRITLYSPDDTLWIEGNVNMEGTITIVGSFDYDSLLNKPTSLADINSTESSKLSGIAAGATVGATWGTNLNSVPSFLSATAPDNSLSLTATFMGFHATGSNWPIKIANDGGVGKFYAGNGSTKFMSWDGTDLVVQGSLKTAASGKRVEIRNTDNEIEFFNSSGTSAGSIVGNSVGGNSTLELNSQFVRVNGNTFTINAYVNALADFTAAGGIYTSTGFYLSGHALTYSDVGAAASGHTHSYNVNLGITSIEYPLTTTGGVLDIPMANISTDGALSYQDWNTFNGKANASTTLSGYGITDAYYGSSIPTSYYISTGTTWTYKTVTAYPLKIGATTLNVLTVQ
jgi:hypothetical protein